jgi:hypothetical protein
MRTSSDFVKSSPWKTFTLVSVEDSPTDAAEFEHRLVRLLLLLLLLLFLLCSGGCRPGRRESLAAEKAARAVAVSAMAASSSLGLEM